MKEHFKELLNLGFKKYIDPNHKKPIKYCYPNQNRERKAFIKFILPYLSKDPYFKRVWIWGSLSPTKSTGNTFGIYETPYQEKDASDVDLLVEVDEKAVGKMIISQNTSKK